MSELTTPLILAIGTIMAMLALRNSDLATRCRTNTKDRAEIPANSKLSKNLRLQNIIFIMRYSITSIAFIVLAYGLKIATSGGVDQAIECLTFAIYLTVVEFAVGPVTLIIDAFRGQKDAT